jgi:GMP synthase-like glutamine amidotransferase
VTFDVLVKVLVSGPLPYRPQPMRVLTIVHDADAGPGVFDGVLTAAGVDVDTWLPAERHQPVPEVDGYDAIMSFGGSAHPHQHELHPWLATEKRLLGEALAVDVPVLGICLGSELIAEVAGSRATHLPHPEIGWYEVALTDEGRRDPVLGPVGERFEALEWHSYAVALPDGAVALAEGGNCLQAYRVGERAWGLQFHAEVTDADFQHWLDNYSVDEDAVREGIDPGAIAAATAPRMAAWHRFGEGICSRFLESASR